jgi:long-chain acyl-CoA synthetase
MKMTQHDIAFMSNPLHLCGCSRIPGGSFIAGGTLVLQSKKFFLGKILRELDSFKGTILWFPPGNLAMLLQASTEILARYKKQVRAVVVYSAPTPEIYTTKICELWPETHLFNAYGSSESGQSFWHDVSTLKGGSSCIGGSSKHSRIQFVDAQGAILEKATREKPGIIAISGETVMQGYWKDPELTREKLQDNLLITSDAGYVDENGLAYCLGRYDDIINTGGYKVSPLQIENLVVTLPGIAECACVPEPDLILGQVPKLFVVMKPDYTFSSSVIKSALRSCLEPALCPRTIVQVESIPRTESLGKVNRAALM